MIKHTEGVWELMKSNGELMVWSYDNEGNKIPICDISKLAAYAGIICNADKKEEVANAQLIAAAPELLEAAKDSLQYVRDNNYLDHGNPNHPSPLAEELQQAIEKAEGGRNE